MPKETTHAKEVQTALDVLEHSLDNFTSRAQSYKIMQALLDKDEHIDVEVIKRLLAACIHDMTTKRLNSVYVMKIIASIILKIKMGNYDPAPDLQPSALAIIDLLKTVASLSKVESLVQLSYRTLSSYPENILIAIADNNGQIMDILRLYCHMEVPFSLRMEALDFLMKLLQILPPKKRRIFVMKGTSLWFSKIIPLVIVQQTNECPEHDKMELLELLTDELVYIDYADNQHWHNILDSICDKKQYPFKMKDLLHAGNDAWHRLWKIFIRLLKTQLTQTINKVCCPINSILPVVETAFKLDVKSRCKAFECWTVLIDSFSNEAIGGNINKTIKLLIVPLIANNAKSEEVVTAKFKCWWHLFRKFQDNIDKFLDKVLLSFLHFCFGKHNILDKPEISPDLFSLNIKRLCNQAVVDIVGHVNCDGCTELPKLNGKLINTKHLVDNWKQWVYVLTSVIKTVGSDHGLNPQQIKCLWKSFILTIAELPDNSIKKDLFANLPLIITYFVQNCSSDSLLGVVFDVLIISIFEDEAQIKPLFKLDNNAITGFVKILLDESLSEYIKNMTTSILMSKLKTVTDFIFDEEVSYTPKKIINDILIAMPKTDTALLLWVAIAESLSKSYCENVKIAYNVLLWPLTAINLLKEVKTAAMTWYTTYNVMNIQLNAEFNNEILEILNSTPDDSISNIYFKLCVALAILKHKCSDCNNLTCENELNLLATLTKAMIEYEDYMEIFPILVERIVAIMTIVTSKVNDIATPLILISVKNVLHVLTEAYKNGNNMNLNVSRVADFIEDVLKPLDKIITMEPYYHLFLNMIDHLLKYFSILIAHLPIQSIIISILNKLLAKMDSADTNYNEIISLIAIVEKSELKSEAVEDKILETNKFATPLLKGTSKQKQIKETSIVKTVVENGEEYVVVKSNWKFNPRKLTENQKEKLQRKREDIPALYQDLSQSQDELNLVSWKSNSQDNNTSSSLSESKSSKPDNNGTASEILKNLPNSNIVPRILENIISENTSKISTKKELLLDNYSSKVEPSATVPQITKTPRMALKDRVFRNVRNLIENSRLKKGNLTSPVDPNKTDSNIKQIHNGINNVESIVHSAPPLLSADRPSRLKRKPKKFDDSLLLTSKKARYSLQDSDIADVNNSRTSINSVQPMAENKYMKNVDGLKRNNETNLDVSLIDKNVQEIKNKTHSKSGKGGDIAVVGESVNADTNDVQTHVCKNSATLEPITKMKEEAAVAQSLSQINETLDVSKKLDNLTDPASSKKLNMEEPDTSRNVTQISTPKSSKYLREISTPKTSEVGKEMLTSNVAKEVNKEVSTAKNAKEISTTKSLKESIEVTSPIILKYGKNISTPKDKTIINNKNTSSDIVTEFNDIITPSKDITEISETPTMIMKLDNNHSIEICKADQPKRSLSPSASNDLKETRTTKVSQNVMIASESTEIMTPVQTNLEENKPSLKSKFTSKNSKNRKARIEKELAIDMVEGHPFLKIQTERRLTRKALETVSTGRRKSATRKLNTSLSDVVGTCINKSDNKKIKEKISSSTSVIVDEQKDSVTEKQSLLSDDLPNSEDIIESSQDSTVTTMSVKTAKKVLTKIPVVSISKMLLSENNANPLNNSQSILDSVTIGMDRSVPTNQESNDDIELPLNKTVLDEKSENISFLKSYENHTENMDTEPLDAQEVFNEVIIISDDVPDITTAKEGCVIGSKTQEIAEADTQPTDPIELMDITVTQDDIYDVAKSSIVKLRCESVSCTDNDEQFTEAKDLIDSENYDTNTLSNTVCEDIEQSRASSPFKDQDKRQQDFLSNTIEISPIKTMSPNRDKKSPSPETSSDYVVIKLTSPVHNNGDPFDKFDSPEVFTGDKVFPDKRDQSPPRTESNISVTSPSLSLSLKKNKPLVRSGGRAAQMLDLCVPEKVKSILNPEKDDDGKGSTITPARRNLKNIYNTATDNTDSVNSHSENDDTENFLMFRRSLPAVNSSPSGSILKRKFAEITDDAIISPACKRKRVSFHDPPVSTTISVQKYIEPGVLRSPQNSALKRIERQLRQHSVLKSPKRLDNVFKLDTALTKTIESFSENEVNTSDDTQPISLDETPVVEVIRTSELNDTDPICPELIDCKDSIENVAGELSSSAMKSLLVKELEAKVETIGDLAKMTELEVNRLCIKAPKVKVAKQVLSDYAAKRIEVVPEKMIIVEEADIIESINDPLILSKWVNTEVQTDSVMNTNIGLQTVEISKGVNFSQTEIVQTVHTSIQTNDSGSKSTADLIKSCLSDRPDFVEQLSEQLSLTEFLAKKTTSDIKSNRNNSSSDKNEELSSIRDYLCDKYSLIDLMFFLSEVAKIAHERHSQT